MLPWYEIDGFSCVKSLAVSLKTPDYVTGIIDSNYALELCIDSIFNDTELINNTNDVDIKTKIDDEEKIMLKITGTVALLIAKLDPKKWKKHLRRENYKWAARASCDKTICVTFNATLLTYKKLVEQSIGCR